MPAPLRAWLATDLRRGAFGIGAPPRARRIGAEAELIPVCADTGVPVPICGDGISSLPPLRRHGARTGWVEGVGKHGAPVFRPPQGGTISYEPGGQIEYSSAPCASVAELVRALHAVLLPLRASLAEQGVRLLAVGIDPANPLERTSLQLRSPRYARMAEYFQRLGPAGARMMRQTASFQVNLDWEDEPLERWGVLNAAAPYLLAVFAHSPEYAGRATGARSYRARVWRELDPTRTGVADPSGDPVERYLDFALAAPAMLAPDPEGASLPFAERLRRGETSADDWRLHLTTLFPEVRPKGYAEVRSLDALEPEWYAVPLVLLAGLTYHAPTRRAASDLLGPADPDLLAPAGERGLSDPRIGPRAADLFLLGLQGAAALGERMISGEDLERARAFFELHTRNIADHGLRITNYDLDSGPIGS